MNIYIYIYIYIYITCAFGKIYHWIIAYGLKPYCKMCCIAGNL